MKAITGTVLLITDRGHSILGVAGSSEAMSYMPFGQKRTCSCTTLGFNGEHVEPPGECYLLGNGYRSYHPRLQRFASPDTLSPFGSGGLNAYAYVVGDPVNHTDPSGHVPALLGRRHSFGGFSARTEALSLAGLDDALWELGQLEKYARDLIGRSLVHAEQSVLGKPKLESLGTHSLASLPENLSPGPAAELDHLSKYAVHLPNLDGSLPDDIRRSKFLVSRNVRLSEYRMMPERPLETLFKGAYRSNEKLRATYRDDLQIIFHHVTGHRAFEKGNCGTITSYGFKMYQLARNMRLLRSQQ